MAFTFKIELDGGDEQTRAEFKTMSLDALKAPSPERPDGVQAGQLLDRIKDAGQVFILVRAEERDATWVFMRALENRASMKLKIGLFRDSHEIYAVRFAKATVASFERHYHGAYAAKLLVNSFIGTNYENDSTLKYVVRISEKRKDSSGKSGTNAPASSPLLQFETHRIEGRDWPNEDPLPINEASAGSIFQKIRVQKYASVLVGEGPGKVTTDAGLVFLDAQKNRTILTVDIDLRRETSETTYKIERQKDDKTFWPGQPVIPKITPITAVRGQELAELSLDEVTVDDYRTAQKKQFIVGFKAQDIRETDNAR